MLEQSHPSNYTHIQDNCGHSGSRQLAFSDRPPNSVDRNSAPSNRVTDSLAN